MHRQMSGRNAWLLLPAALLAAWSPAARGGAARLTSVIAANSSSAGSACASSPPGCGQGSGFAADLAAGSWSAIPTAPLSPRSFATVVWTGSQLVVWGGATTIGDNQVPTSNGAVWNEATGTWHAMAPSPLSSREGAAGVWDGHGVLIWGGDNAGQHPKSYRMFVDGAIYDPEDNTWQLLANSPLSARTRATATWTGSEVLVVGGGALDAPATGPPSTALSVAAFSPSTGRWESLPRFPGAPARPSA